MLTKFKGAEVEFGGERKLVVPALTLRQIQGLQARLGAYSGASDAESIDTAIDTVHAALSRNYPDLSRDEVADMIDLSNLAEVMNAVMGISGLVEKEPGEVPASAGLAG